MMLIAGVMEGRIGRGRGPARGEARGIEGATGEGMEGEEGITGKERE